jgi:cobalt-zinc-cadmium efflux system outer membrane protein
LKLSEEVELKRAYSRWISVFFLCLLTLISKRSLAQKLDLDSLMAEALKVNPDLKAAELRYQSFEAKVSQAGTLPDPMFKGTASNLPIDSWSLDQSPMSGVELMLTQRFPFPGKLGLAEKTARSMAQKTKEDYESVKNFMLGELKRNYYQLYLLDKSIEIIQKNKLLIEDFARIASTKYSVGKGIQQDVLKAQVEVSKMIDKLISLEEMKKMVQAKINILLNRSPQDFLGETSDLSFREFSYSEEELQNLALANNPSLKGRSFQVSAARLSYDLAKREYWPDFSLSASYRIRDVVPMDPVKGKDFVSFSADLNIPLYFWSKQKKKVQEKALDLESSRQEYKAAQNNVKSGVSSVYYSLDKYRKEIQLYGTAILPQARQSLESAQSGYQVDKVDFLTLLNNQITLFNYEIAYYQALSSYFQSIAKLEEMAGKPLP